MSASNSVPNFAPSINGFHFANNLSGDYPVLKLPVVGNVVSGKAGNGLCGGFAFAVRDLFDSRPRMLPTVEDAYPPHGGPADGTPDFQLVSTRFVDSLGPVAFENAAKVIGWIQTPGHDVTIELQGPGLAHRMVVDEWPKLWATIDSGHPCPLFLVMAPQCGIGDIVGIVDALGHSHQVLAYSYDLDDQNNLTIGIYDPNDPDDDHSTISLNISNPANTIAVSAPRVLANISDPITIRGFFCAVYDFVDPGADPNLRRANNATFVTQSVPSTMTPGQPTTVSVLMRNTGALTWSKASGHRLGSQSPQDNSVWGTGRIELTQDVPPGDQIAFEWTVTQVPSAGAPFQWRMVQEGVEWFGDPTPVVDVATQSTNACQQVAGRIASAEADIAALQRDLRGAAGGGRVSAIREIAQAEMQLRSLQAEQKQLGCV